MILIDLDTEAAAALDVISAGMEARCYVTGALDPAFSEPADRDRLAKRLARMSPGLAVAFLRGWASHRGSGNPRPVAWHRYMAGVAIEVVSS